jgi:hypothetical protein
MLSKAIPRALLLLALIVAANAAKPISTSSVTRHLLRTAQSFSFLLPAAALNRLAQANYLAEALGRGLSNWSDSLLSAEHTAVLAFKAPAPARPRRARRASAAPRPRIAPEVASCPTDEGRLAGMLVLPSVALEQIAGSNFAPLPEAFTPVPARLEWRVRTPRLMRLDLLRRRASAPVAESSDCDTPPVRAETIRAEDEAAAEAHAEIRVLAIETPEPVANLQNTSPQSCQTPMKADFDDPFTK